MEATAAQEAACAVVRVLPGQVSRHTQICMAAALGTTVHNSRAYGVEAGLH